MNRIYRMGRGGRAEGIREHRWVLCHEALCGFPGKLNIGRSRLRSGDVKAHGVGTDVHLYLPGVALTRGHADALGDHRDVVGNRVHQKGQSMARG